MVCLQHGGTDLKLPVCRHHWQQLEAAYHLSTRHVLGGVADVGPCAICAGEETIDNRTWLEYQGTAGPIALCRKHAKDLEECRIETARIRTPPVFINLSAVTSGTRIGGTS